MVVLGVSSRMDVVDLLDPRVTSRFSMHKLIFDSLTDNITAATT